MSVSKMSASTPTQWRWMEFSLWCSQRCVSCYSGSSAEHPCSLPHLQVCRADGEQRSPGLGVAGAEGVLHCPAYHQHREERHGVHAAPRPQTSPRPGIEPPHPHPPTSFSKGKEELHLIKDFIYFISVVQDDSGGASNTWHFYPKNQKPKNYSLTLCAHRGWTGNDGRALVQRFLFLWSVVSERIVLNRRSNCVKVLNKVLIPL